MACGKAAARLRCRAAAMLHGDKVTSAQNPDDLHAAARPVGADELTNCLDLHSVEALEGALSAHPGALLFAGCDPRFSKSARVWRGRWQAAVCRCGRGALARLMRRGLRQAWRYLRWTRCKFAWDVRHLRCRWRSGSQRSCASSRLRKAGMPFCFGDGCHTGQRSSYRSVIYLASG